MKNLGRDQNDQPCETFAPSLFSWQVEFLAEEDNSTTLAEQSFLF